MKRHFNELANTLDVQVYSTPKVHGTRFVNHVRFGLARLLNNWSVLMQALENAVEVPSFRNIKPKHKNVLKKLKNFTFLSTCGLMKQILDNISQLSLVMEKGDLKAYDIIPGVEKTKSRNEDVLNDNYLMESCNIQFFMTKGKCSVNWLRRAICEENKRTESSSISLVME